MAKIIIAGDAMVVTSAVKFEDIQKLEKYRPEVLQIVDEEKNPVFVVGTTVGKCGREGSINQYGASFAGKSRDGQGLATITLKIPAGTENAKEYAAEHLGASLMKLNEVEAKIPAALEAVAAQEAKIRENIAVL